MNPPPPPLTFSRRKDGPPPDPTLGDEDLAAARSALAGGRWADARALLIETADDWDRRGHRALVLADASSAEAWAGDWQQTEPDSPDAALLLACATTARALAGKRPPGVARTAITAAAGAAPDDPTPHLAALRLAAHTGSVDECRRAFAEVCARHPEHHHAHHLMTAVAADAFAEDEVYDFARDAAAAAPADSPLALLPVVAHAERFRVLAHGAGNGRPDAAAQEHWSGRRARFAVRSAFDWWLEWDSGNDHPRRAVDLNFLAHAKFHEGRLAEAAALFQRIGPLLTAAPWSYAGSNPARAFRSARDAAYGAA
jgi:hypothetical protein